MPEGRWTHDRYDGPGGADRRSLGGRVGGGVNATTKLLISNLDFGVSDNDVKVVLWLLVFDLKLDGLSTDG